MLGRTAIRYGDLVERVLRVLAVAAVFAGFPAILLPFTLGFPTILFPLAPSFLLGFDRFALGIALMLEPLSLNIGKGWRGQGPAVET